MLKNMPTTDDDADTEPTEVAATDDKETTKS
jgi:hypothetical protein